MKEETTENSRTFENFKKFYALKLLDNQEELIKRVLVVLCDDDEFNLIKKIDKLTTEVNELKLYIMNKKQASTEHRKNRISKKDRDYLLNKLENKCSICHKENERKYLHIDHIVPISKGGTNEVSNLQVLCVECNLAKKDYIQDCKGRCKK